MPDSTPQPAVTPAVEIVLHIGLEKTGSTTIQGFLKANRTHLLQQGVLFPESPGQANQTLLAAACMSDDVNIRARALERHGPQFAQVLRTELAAEVDANAPQRLLLSNEHCSSRLGTPEEVGRLHALLGTIGTVTRIIVYLRRQDDFLLSTYSTSVKSGSAEAFSVPTGPNRMARYDYRKLLELWGDAFGFETLCPRVFQRAAWVGHDLLTDFCDAAQIEAVDTDVPVKNLSLSAEGLEYLRLRNARTGGIRDGGIVRVVSRVTKGAKLTLDSAARERFLANFAEGNAWVAREFFGRDDLFDAVDDDLVHNGLPTIAPDRMHEIDAAVETAAEALKKKRARRQAREGRA